LFIKTVICGGRDYIFTDAEFVLLDHLRDEFGITHVISGQARGADTGGEKWGKSRGLIIISKPAKWDLYGKRAGFLRNEEMAEIADLVIAFPGGKGTQHMINIAKKKYIPVIEPEIIIKMMDDQISGFRVGNRTESDFQKT